MDGNSVKTAKKGSEAEPAATNFKFYVMGAWKQAVFMGISYCHSRVATPPSPDSEPSSSATPTFPVCHPDMWQAVQSLVDTITAGGSPADEWNMSMAVHGNDAGALVLCACEWLVEEAME
eukprot:3933749-Rhodomonas_salina.1